MFKRIILGLVIPGLISCAPPALKHEKQSSEELTNSVYFVDEINREYVLDFENSRAAVVKSHSGVILKNCSTEKFHCLVGDTIIASPKDCTNFDFETEWIISEDKRLTYISRDPRNGDYFLKRIPASSKQSVGKAGSDGIIFSKARGVVGLWFSAHSDPYLAQISTIFRLSSRSDFLACGEG